MEKSSVHIPREGDQKCVTLSPYILPKDATTLTGIVDISQAYHDGQEYLTNWQSVIAQMYPDHPNLLALFPLPPNLTLAKLGNKAMLLTDTCNTTHEFC